MSPLILLFVFLWFHCMLKNCALSYMFIYSRLLISYKKWNAEASLICLSSSKIKEIKSSIYPSMYKSSASKTLKMFAWSSQIFLISKLMVEYLLGLRLSTWSFPLIVPKIFLIYHWQKKWNLELNDWPITIQT